MRLFKFLHKLSSKKSTLLFRIRYSGFTELQGKNFVGKRTVIRPFFNQDSTIKVTLKKDAHIHSDVIIQGSGNFVFGERSFIGSFSVIGCNESIIIGDDVMIAQNVSIRDTDHEFKALDKPMLQQGMSCSPITIHDNVWIGHGAVITKGITIHSGAIIGANAVVTKDVEANAIMGGVPAKFIRLRTDK